MNDENVRGLSTYRRLVDRVEAAWPGFQTDREAHLAQGARFDGASEKAAEKVIEDLFTKVLDWSESQVNNQIDYADIVFTRGGIKRLLIEAKRPGLLLGHRPAMEKALTQAQRYAAEQKVSSIAVSDGVMLYAADVAGGGLRDRAFVRLDHGTPAAHELWWLSVDGIYRPRPDRDAVARRLDAPTDPVPTSAPPEPGLVLEEPLHPKYRLPARCFAYAGDPRDPATWHLPYRRADGRVDGRRLPKAIQAILTNYRGAHVRTVPEAAIPDVLVRLARGAVEVGRFPGTVGVKVSPVYLKLRDALDQLDRLGEVVPGDDG